MRHTAVLLAATVALLAGCGGKPAAQDSSPSASHTMADGTVMDGSSMDGSSTDGHVLPTLPPGKGRPSSIALMVCGDEIAGTVQRTLGLSKPARGLHAFVNHDYRCLYPLGAGELRISVKDLDEEGPGRAYFDHLRETLPGARDLGPLESYGLPGFETRSGNVVIIKDHKTLWVDATAVNRADLPEDMTRQHAAYVIAANVVACWDE